MGSVTIRPQGQALRLSGAVNAAGGTVGVWADAALSSALSLPVAVDSDVTVWLRDGAVTLTVSDAEGVTVWSDRVIVGTAPVDISPLPSLQVAAARGVVNVQDFASSGTWTKPAGARLVEVILVSGGNGGGSGCSNATAAGGGGGGGCSGWNHARFVASSLPATVAVTVGAGGAGGASVTGANGLPGQPGGDSGFGGLVFAWARNVDLAQNGAGAGGTNAAGGAGGGTCVGSVGPWSPSAAGGAGGAPGANGSLAGSGAWYAGAPGAGGGGVNTTTSGVSGAAYRPQGSQQSGDAYITAGENAYAGQSLGVGGTSGAAGAAGSIGGSAGVAGGAGGFPGGAGAGGGASLGGASGAGGAGGGGRVVVITWM